MYSRTNKEDKKKRLGSRRFKAKQNESCEAEDSSLAQCHIQEENTETSSILSNPDKLQSESQPLSEHLEKRRKLGSSRINKGRQLLKNPEPESYRKPEGKHEEENRGNEDLETTHMSSTQFENQEELNQGEKHDVSAPHDSSLHSATSTDYSSETEHIIHQEDVLKLMYPQSENEECKVVTDSDKSRETILEETCKSDTLQSEEVKENAHVDDFSDVTSLSLLSYPSIEQQLIDQSSLRNMPKEEFLKVYSATGKENTKQDEDTDSLPQEGNLLGTYVMSESHVGAAGIIVHPTHAEKPPVDEVLCESFSASLASRLPKTSVSAAEETDSGINPIGNRRKLGSSRKNKERQHVKGSAAESYHKANEEVVENVQTSVTNTSDTHQNEKCSSQCEETAHLLGISELNSSLLQINPEVSQQLIGPPSVGEMPNEFLSMSSETENENNSREDTDLLVEQADFQASSFVSEPFVDPQNIDSHITPEVTTEITGSGEHIGPECSVEETTAASEKEFWTNEEQNFNLLHTVENTDVCSGNPTNQSEFKDTQQSELHVNHSVTNQEVSNPDEKQNKSTKLNNSGPLGWISKDDHVYNTKKPHMRETERRDTGLSQVYEIECLIEDEINPSTEQTSHQHKKGIFFGGEERKSSLQNLESEIHSTQSQRTLMSTDEQNTDFNHTGNRRKLEIRPTSKGNHHLKNSIAESYHENKEENIKNNRDNEALETTKGTLALETMRREETTVHDAIVSVTNDDSLCSASVPDQSSEVQNPTTTHSPEADVQQENDEEEDDESLEASREGREVSCSLQSKEDYVNVTNDSRENSEIIYVNPKVTDKQQSELSFKDSDDFAKHHGHPTKENNSKALYQVNVDYHVHDTNDQQTTDTEHLQTGLFHVTEGQVEDDIKPTADQTGHQEINELWSLGGHTEAECSAEQLIVSSNNEELYINKEQNEGFNLSEVRGDQPSEGGLNTLNGKYVKQIQELSQTDYPSESVACKVTENPAIPSANPINQVGFKDTHRSELSVENTDFSNNKQDVSNSGKYKHPTIEDSIDTLDQTSDHYVCNTEKPQTRDTGADTGLIQVSLEIQGQVEEATEPTAEHTNHQEGHFSDVNETECSLQTLGSEIHKPVDPLVSILQTNCKIEPVEDVTMANSNTEAESLVVVKSPGQEGTRKSNEAVETTKMSVTLQTTGKEELSKETVHDISMSVTYDGSLYPSSTSDHYICVQNPHKTNCPEDYLESLIGKTECVQEEREQRETHITEEMSEDTELVEAALDKMDNPDSLCGKEVRVVSPSEDAANKVHEHEAEQAQKQEMSHNYTPEGVIHETADSSEITSVNPADQDELKDTSESVMSLTNTDDSATKQEDFNSDNKLTDENNMTALKRTDQDHHVSDAASPCAETAATGSSQLNKSECQEEKNIKPTAEQANQLENEGLVSSFQALQSVVRAPLDPQTQQNSVSICDSINALDQTSDLYDYNTEKPQTGDTGADTGLIQVSLEIQGQVEEATEPTAEHTNHQEGLFSDVNETECSLQTLGSEIHKPVDPPAQDNSFSIDEQDNTDFRSMGNRRKLGSSRRNKGRHKVKDVVAESNQQPTEVRGNLDNDSSETTKRRTEIQKIPLGTTLEATDPAQTKDVSYQVGEDAKSGTTEITTAGVQASVTVDQQVTDQSNFTEMHDDECPHVPYATDTENNEREEDKDILMRWGILQANSLVSDTHLNSEDMEPSVTLEKTTEERSPGERTDPKWPIEQATLSSSQEEVSTNEEQNEHFTLTEVTVSQHTENAAQKVPEEELDTTEMQQVNPVDYCSVKLNKSSVQSVQSEVHAPLDSQTRHSSQNVMEETHAGFKPTEHRRKLGSSRRNKGRQHELDNSASETYHKFYDNAGNTWTDEACEETKTSTGTTRQEELKHPTDQGVKPTETPENDTTFSQDVADDSITVTTGVTARPDENETFKSSEEEIKHMKETEDVTLLTDHSMVKLDLIQSPEGSIWKSDPETHNISYHVDNVAFRSVTSDAVSQEETFQVHNMEPASYNKDLLEQYLDADVSKESGNLTAVGVHEIQQAVQVETCLEDKSKQKRRKMGSTRKIQHNRKDDEICDKHETRHSMLDTDADTIKHDRPEVVDDLQLILTSEVSQPSMGMQTVESNVTPGTHHLMTLLPEPSASQSEDESAPVGDSGRNLGEEPSQLSDFTSTEMQATSGAAGRERRSVSTKDAVNPENSTFCEPALAEQANIQVSIHEPLNVNEEANDTNSEIKNASPNINSANRRRKMGSTRRNLGSPSRRDDLHQKQEVDNERPETAGEFVGGLSENASGAKELQPHREHQESDSEQRKETEEVEHSHISEPEFKPRAEINPAPFSRAEETELQVSPDYLDAKPSTSPKQDVTAESSHEGRRRKMGSHRKSRGNPHNEDPTARGDRITDAHKGQDGLTQGRGIRTANEHRDEAHDNITGVDESDKKLSSNISFLKAGESLRPGSDNKPKQVTGAEVRRGTASHEFLSLAGQSTRAVKAEKSYNVLMVGDTSVGKTSFMKRAQSGKFSFDLPASVGLDSCMWTVVVDGKPVVLHLWDTAGQERFHSITRQIFHKAQAFLLMYDITSSNSFSAVSYWANCIQEGAADNVTILLLGNKSDCAERRVKMKEGESLAKEYNFEFMECSAATGDNVIECLETMARMLSQKAETRQEAVALKQEPQQKNRSGCC